MSRRPRYRTSPSSAAPSVWSPQQISDPAGAFIVTAYGIVERYGPANLLIATPLSRLLLVMGWL